MGRGRLALWLLAVALTAGCSSTSPALSGLTAAVQPPAPAGAPSSGQDPRPAIVVATPAAAPAPSPMAAVPPLPQADQPPQAVAAAAPLAELTRAATQERDSVLRLPPAVAPPQPSGGYRLLIPVAGINAPVVEVGVDPDGAMAAPNGPDVVGWFAPGPRPGGPGNVLMDGHVDWADRVTGIPSTAVFWRLREVNAGDELAVVAGDTRYVYSVRESVSFTYDDPSAARVLAQSREALLTIITCEGNFSAAQHNYSHRRVIIAQLARTE